jgi:protein disulfide-isomerase A6
VGGKLSALAGTIPSFDSVISSIVETGKDWVGAGEQFLAAAAKTEGGKYVDYYVKVAQKLTGNSGYAEKELTRLEKILKKGGLAPEKLDDIISRSNILRKFGIKAGKDEL